LSPNSGLQSAPSAGDPLHDAIARLSAVVAGRALVVSCYLKLEPRDKTRRKYVIKMKNRVKQATAELATRALDREVRDQAVGDLERVLGHFEQAAVPSGARGVAVFACSPIGLFEVVPLPHVHRSRLAVTASPLMLELVALEEEFGIILVAVSDRTSARFFSVTAYGAEELAGLAAPESSRAGKFHGERRVVHGSVAAGGSGEHHYHMRIREEKQRHYARVADQIFRISNQRPLTGLVLAGVGVEADALVPHLHTYLHDLLLGVVRLNPKEVSVAQVREAALALREERERAWELAHAEAARDGQDTGWAVNGIEPTLEALQHGQVRTFLADGLDDDRRIDDGLEDALAQGAQVDVLYDERARRLVNGLAALLRFRRP
jgi:peptide chain release factor subunit 1